jgi:hypothetical protein
MPEALRMKGELVLRSCKPDTPNAEELFGRSLALAHRQGALLWELRTATSLAPHLMAVGDWARAPVTPSFVLIVSLFSFVLILVSRHVQWMSGILAASAISAAASSFSSI